MKIRYFQHILQFKQPAGTSRGVYRTRKIWYVTIDNAGIGECAPLPDLSCDAMSDKEYETILAEACRRTEATGEIPYAYLRPFPSILFGLETAWLSYKGWQQTGNPYFLYNIPFSRGESGITINGLVWMGTYEEMMARMEEKLALGFRCIKIKIGAIDWEREISLIRALRERFPKEVVEIRLDANGGFTPEMAMSRLHELARYDIHSIEQPIRQHQWQEMAALCRNTPIPIALDEELIGINDPAENASLLDTIHPQYIILKPSLHGGLRGCEEWIRLATERGIGYWATSALESNVGLNAIAQWTANLPGGPKLPQGLGTGQLFVSNYDAIHLTVKEDALWCGNDKDREFWADYRQFMKEWQDNSPTLTVHTSGSTGNPQPMLVEKSRMAASARMTLDFLGLKAGDTALLCMPLRYIAGKMMVVRALIGQLHLHLTAPTSHPLRDLASAGNYLETEDESLVSPTFLAVTPMQALATLKVPEERRIFEKIPVIIIGGGAITLELHTALQSCKGRVFSTYGMTETLSHIAMRRLNGPEQSESYTPLQGVTISKNEDGCLTIEAPALCPTRLDTHDLCEIADDGTFRILGRKDNIICSGGIKLSLEKLEEKLGDIGQPYLFTAVCDPLLGEALTLLVAGEAMPELDRLLLSRLDTYERPRHKYLVKTLPLTETGKPARAVARTWAQEARRKALEMCEEQNLKG